MQTSSSTAGVYGSYDHTYQEVFHLTVPTGLYIHLIDT